MTSIVGIRCADGVVIGADSSATFGDGVQRTIEQLTEKKIQIVGDRVIIAGTGYVGHAQRFGAAIEKLWKDDAFKGKTGIEIAKALSAGGVNDFGQTMPGPHLKQIGYSAFVAYPAGDKPFLCELSGQLGFQPEIKDPDDLWFASAGSGQSITDPFLALFRSTFWADGPPPLQGGIFTALWALRHACEVNPGGIKDPIRIAVLEWNKGKMRARQLSEDEMQEHGNMVDSATKHMVGFRDILLGKAGAAEIPRP